MMNPHNNTRNTIKKEFEYQIKFKELFKFGDEKGLIINWGNKGFSLNVAIGNKRVSLLQGYSYLRSNGQTMYSTVESISKKVKKRSEIVIIYVSRTLELDGFKSVNNGFIFNLERDLIDEDWAKFKSIISNTVEKIKNNSLKRS